MQVNQVSSASQGSLLPYIFPVFAIVILLVTASHLLLRKIAPKAYSCIGERRVVSGYLSMIAFIVVVAAFRTSTVTFAVNESLAAINTVFIYVALIGLPLIVLLSHLGLLKLLWVVGSITLAVSLITMAGEIVNYGSEVGWDRWQSAGLDTVSYVSGVAIAFCFGARVSL